jgi:hypothetical protein
MFEVAVCVQNEILMSGRREFLPGLSTLAGCRVMRENFRGLVDRFLVL